MVLQEVVQSEFWWCTSCVNSRIDEKLDLDLDEYVVGPLGINTTEERARGNLVPLVDGCSETANCLCMHDTLVQVVPIHNGIWKK